MPQKVLDLFACWNQMGGRDLAKAIWRMAPLCVIWCIWREKNVRLFEDKECLVDWVGEEYDCYATLVGDGALPR